MSDAMSLTRAVVPSSDQAVQLTTKQPQLLMSGQRRHGLGSSVRIGRLLLLGTLGVARMQEFAYLIRLKQPRNAKEVHLLV